MHRVLLLILFFAAARNCAAEAVKAVLFPFREAEIAARADSTLMPYRFKLGEAFAENAVIATLDDSRYALEAKRAERQFMFAKAVLEDSRKLREKDFTSDFELKKASFDCGIAESNFEEAKLNLAYCTIRAPFAGKIVEFKTREYETVRQGQPLFRIIDDNRLLAVMNVSPDDAGLTKVGGAAVISLSETGRKVKGTVYEVAPQIDHRTGTVRIRVLIENRDGALCAGMTGELVHGE